MLTVARAVRVGVQWVESSEVVRASAFPTGPERLWVLLDIASPRRRDPLTTVRVTVEVEETPGDWRGVSAFSLVGHASLSTTGVTGNGIPLERLVGRRIRVGLESATTGLSWGLTATVSAIEPTGWGR